MAKGDHNRSENKVDEQQTIAQNYLTGVQSQLGSQYGNLATNYFGPSAPSYGNVVGQGTTIPTYNNTGPFGGGSSSSNYLDPNFDPNSEFMDAINHFGFSPQGYRGNVDEMTQVANYLNQQHPGQNWTPGSERAGDWMGYGNNGQGLDVLPADDSHFQTLPDSVNSGSGGSGGYFGGSYGGGLFGQAEGDYNTIQGEYQNFLGEIPGMYNGLIGAASNMASTGGISDQDKADMRSRAMSPVRSAYQQGVENLDRSRALQGGYSPGYATALGRFNRIEGQGASDAITNADAGIAELAQKGKIAGLGAWGEGLGGFSNAMLGGIGGMRSMYGTNPGMADTFGNQMLQASGQQLTAAGHQNDLSLGIMGAENYIGANVPGNTASTLGNVNSLANSASRLAGMAYPWMTGGSSTNNNNAPTADSGFAPQSGEVYGGNSLGSTPYNSYQFPSQANDYNWNPAQGTYNDPGQYGLGTVPNYGPGSPDYGPGVIDQYDNPWAV